MMCLSDECSRVATRSPAEVQILIDALREALAQPIRQTDEVAYALAP